MDHLVGLEDLFGPFASHQNLSDLKRTMMATMVVTVAPLVPEGNGTKGSIRPDREEYRRMLNELVTQSQLWMMCLCDAALLAWMQRQARMVCLSFSCLLLSTS